MKVIKATKLFRQITMLGSLFMALASIGLLIAPLEDCSTSNLKATTLMIFILWCLIFVLMLV